MNKKKKIVLAFSGGLDTSIILKWLQNEMDAEVVTFTAFFLITKSKKISGIS